MPSSWPESRRVPHEHGKSRGGLGLQATAVAKDMGAQTVIVIDQIPGRLELARAFGADYTINIREVTDKKSEWHTRETTTITRSAIVIRD